MSGTKDRGNPQPAGRTGRLRCVTRRWNWRLIALALFLCATPILFSPALSAARAGARPLRAVSSSQAIYEGSYPTSLVPQIDQPVQFWVRQGKFACRTVIAGDGEFPKLCLTLTVFLKTGLADISVTGSASRMSTPSGDSSLL